MKNRIVWLDIAKALGIFFIVSGHTLQGSVFLRQYAYAFSVPFFFFLTGITYRTKPWKVFCFDNLRRIIIPYFSFAIISIIIFNALSNMVESIGNVSTTAIVPNLLGAIFANSRTGMMKWNVPLWFLPCMFATTVVVELFEKYCVPKSQKPNEMRVVFSLTLLFLFACIDTMFPTLMLPFQFETAFIMAVYMELGIILRNTELFLHMDDGGISVRTLCVCAVACLIIGAIASCSNGYTDIRLHNFGENFLFYIGSSSAISAGIVMIATALAQSKVYVRWLCYTGRHTMGILLMHKFPILVFQTLIPVSKNLLLNESATIPGMLWAVTVSVIVIAMCLAVEKLFVPIVPWAFGINSR